MKLGELVAGIGPVQGGSGSGSSGAGADVEIGGLAYDSRTVAPGTLFFCVPGLAATGTTSPRRRSRAAPWRSWCERPLGLGVPEVVVPSVRAAMAPVAARFYGDPTARAAGRRRHRHERQDDDRVPRARAHGGGRARGAGCWGPSSRSSAGSERAVKRTTPEAIDLQAEFRAMLDGGDRACAMEVSSHALALGRADGVHFAAAIFTNLTQDHLDFHATMEEYFQAKRRLFVPDVTERRRHPARAVSVVNVGDPYGRRLAHELEVRSTFAVLSERERRTTATPPTATRPATLPTTVERRALRRRWLAFALVAPTVSATVGWRCRGASTWPTRSARSRPCTRSASTSTRWSAALRARRAGARALRARRRGPGVRGARRLRAHARLARERAARGARAVAAGRVICVFGAAATATAASAR